MRLIDADKVVENIDEWLDSVGYATVGKGLPYYGELIGCVDEAPTLTPQNEPLNCTGCQYLDEQCAPCASCIRARRYKDYYRRPPEGEV